MIAEVALAFLIDYLVGDPPWIPHPVVIIGRFVEAVEAVLRPFCANEAPERFLGGVLAFATVVGSYVACRWTIALAGWASPIVGEAVSVWLASTSIAARGLQKAAHEVSEPLTDGDLVGARAKLQMIVGRDTADLPPQEIVRATVETIAENTCDGVIAPLLYAFIGGVPLAMAYKAVNTLDSMVGYKDERYLSFGRVSAKLDDATNYIPARISGLLLVAAAFIDGLDWKRAFCTMKTDGRNHPSPNSGLSEAAVAGALGIRLGGTNYYAGVPSFRGYLGEPVHPLTTNHIRQAVRLMYIASSICVIVGTAVAIFSRRLALN